MMICPYRLRHHDMKRKRLFFFLTFLIQIQLQKYRNAAYMPNFWDKLRRNVISGDRFIICIGR